MTRKTGKSKLKKIARFHLFFSVSLFFLYLGLSFIYSPEFLISDIRQKYRALADEILTITATVLGPPEKPVVTGEAICDGEDLYVSLDWADDSNSESFDIERDSAPLVSGLVVSQYGDTVVSLNTSYSYVVTANGPMAPGSEASDPVVVSTPEECAAPLPDPEISIVSFDGKNVSLYTGTPETHERRPIFTGTTNIPNAVISITLPSSQNISTQIVANGSGYWSWRPPINVDTGLQHLFIQAVDPLDSGRTVSIVFNFKIKQKSSKEKEQKEAEFFSPVVPVVPTPEPEVTPEPARVPLEFTLAVRKEEVYQGGNLETVIRIDKLDSEYEDLDVVIRYTILDEKGQKIETFLDERTVRQGGKITRLIVIPKYLEGGKYQIQAEIMLDKHNISQIKPFSVLELPVMKLGGGFLITYSQFLSQLGAIASFLLLLLLFWLILFSREYWLYLHSLRHITEKSLIKLGFFGPGSGKGVSG